jgi:hypothetical protein
MSKYSFKERKQSVRVDGLFHSGKESEKLVKKDQSIGRNVDVKGQANFKLPMIQLPIIKNTSMIKITTTSNGGQTQGGVLGGNLSPIVAAKKVKISKKTFMSVKSDFESSKYPKRKNQLNERDNQITVGKERKDMEIGFSGERRKEIKARDIIDNSISRERKPIEHKEPFELLVTGKYNIRSIKKTMEKGLWETKFKGVKATKPHEKPKFPDLNKPIMVKLAKKIPIYKSPSPKARIIRNPFPDNRLSPIVKFNN